MLGWDRYGFNNKRVGTRYVELVFLYPMGSAGHVVHSGASERVKHRHTIFHAQVGPVQFSEKTHRDTLRRTCIFAFDGICGSHSAFRSVWGTKRPRTIFHGRLSPVRFTEKVCRDTLCRTYVFCVRRDLRAT
jgi:hypothetical protein